MNVFILFRCPLDKNSISEIWCNVGDRKKNYRPIIKGFGYEWLVTERDLSKGMRLECESKRKINELSKVANKQRWIFWVNNNRLLGLTIIYPSLIAIKWEFVLNFNDCAGAKWNSPYDYSFHFFIPFRIKDALVEFYRQEYSVRYKFESEIVRLQNFLLYTLLPSYRCDWF